MLSHLYSVQLGEWMSKYGCFGLIVYTDPPLVDALLYGFIGLVGGLLISIINKSFYVKTKNTAVCFIIVGISCLLSMFSPIIFNLIYVFCNLALFGLGIVIVLIVLIFVGLLF